MESCRNRRMVHQTKDRDTQSHGYNGRLVSSTPFLYDGNALNVCDGCFGLRLVVRGYPLREACVHALQQPIRVIYDALGRKQHPAVPCHLPAHEKTSASPMESGCTRSQQL